jgi:hypothetical protein
MLSRLFVLCALAIAAPAFAEQSQESAMTAITVTVAGQTLTATLDDTTAGRDFAAMLPLNLVLADYHGIEKVADLPKRLDTSGAPDSYRPEAGDITVYAPWGNLAIFYKPFQSSRGLVRLGEFEGPIEALIRDGEIPVRIELAD